MSGPGARPAVVRAAAVLALAAIFQATPLAPTATGFAADAVTRRAPRASRPLPPARAVPAARPLPQGAAAAIARFERVLAADVAADSVGAIAAAVVVDGEPVWTAAFGWADRERRTLATPATLFRVGSISKTVTAVTLLRLVERGVIDLDDPVRDALPELRRLANLPAGAPPITYRQLAAHTAGLAREPGASHAARGPFRRWKRKLVAAIPSTAVLDPPGTRYRYSNIGYGILGFALERAAGRPYERLVQELVLDPLGMTSTFLRVPERGRPRLAAGYVNPAADSVDPRVPRAEHRGRGYKVPNGGVYSTVGDLARLMIALSDPPPGASPAATMPVGAPLGDPLGDPLEAAPPARPGSPANAGAGSGSGSGSEPGGASSSGRLLPEPLRRLMLVDQTPGPVDRAQRAQRAQRAGDPVEVASDDPDDRDDRDDRSGYGLGLQLQRIGDLNLAGHSGAVAGYTAYLLFDPATATGVVLLRNYNRGSTNLGAAAGRLLLELRDGTG